PLAVQHQDPPWASANSDRQPWVCVDRGGSAPGADPLPVLRGQALRQRRARVRQLLLARPGRGTALLLRAQRPWRPLARQVLSRARLGVAGWPVSHSRSPQMQNAALRAIGLGSWRYQLLPIPPELFAETIRALPGSGFRGVN